MSPIIDLTNNPLNLRVVPESSAATIGQTFSLSNVALNRRLCAPNLRNVSFANYVSVYTNHIHVCSCLPNRGSNDERSVKSPFLFYAYIFSENSDVCFQGFSQQRF